MTTLSTDRTARRVLDGASLEMLELDGASLEMLERHVLKLLARSMPPGGAVVEIVADLTVNIWVAVPISTEPAESQGG